MQNKTNTIKKRTSNVKQKTTMKNPYVKNRVEAEQFEFNFFEGSKRVPVRLWPKLEEETAIQTLPPDYHYEN